MNKEIIVFNCCILMNHAAIDVFTGDFEAAYSMFLQDMPEVSVLVEHLDVLEMNTS